VAKQPYIPFYLGDYLKDTRILPLNVRGGWVDLILYMWDNKVRGELVGTYDDFARLMTCSKEEAILVIQTLNQKNIFDYADIGEGKMRIESRKMKSMEKLSKTRKTSGLKGGNPILLNQKDNLNTEYKDESNNEGMHLVFSKEKTEKLFFEDFSIIEYTCREKQVDELGAKKYMKKFWDKQDALSEITTRTFSDFKKHYINSVPTLKIKTELNGTTSKKIGRTTESAIQEFIKQNSE